jgi:hypothetical protein
MHDFAHVPRPRWARSTMPPRTRTRVHAPRNFQSGARVRLEIRAKLECCDEFSWKHAKCPTWTENLSVKTFASRFLQPPRRTRLRNAPRQCAPSRVSHARSERRSPHKQQSTTPEASLRQNRRPCTPTKTHLPSSDKTSETGK